MRVAVTLIVATAALTGCGSSKTAWQHKLDSALGAERVEGVMMIDRADDWSGVPRLIDLLEDDDVSVRVLAVQSLRRMTGRNFSYSAYAPERERREGALRWRGWWNAEGRFAKTPGTAPSGGSP